MSDGSVVCGNCGAKVRASRELCPRCRAPLTPRPAAGKAVPAGPVGIDARTAAIALALAAAVVAGIWYVRREPAPRVLTTNPVDPLSARRATTAAAPGAGAAADAPAVFPPNPAFALPGRLPAPSNGDDADALARYRQTLERNPQDGAALYDTGATLLRLGRVQEAASALRQAAEATPDQWAVVAAYGLASARGDRWADAVAAFRRAQAIAPDDLDTRYNLALALQSMADYTGAVEAYRAVIGAGGDTVSSRLGLAISLDRLGRATEAVDAYRQTLQLMPAGPDADRIRSRMTHLGG